MVVAPKFVAPKGAWGAADGPRLFQRLTESYGYLTMQARPCWLPGWCLLLTHALYCAACI